jgi:hypothetical protein
LKRKGRWGFSVTDFEGFAGEAQTILPGDESSFAYLFKKTEFDKYLWAEGMQVRDVPIDIYFVICGGDVAPYSVIISPYSYSSNAVTKLIEWPS